MSSSNDQDDATMDTENVPVPVQANNNNNNENEISSSSSTSTSNNNNKNNPSSNHRAAVSPELLKIYYQRLFPISDLCTWWNYNDHNDSLLLPFREFSFTLKTPDRQQEIYLRNQSFHDASELQAALVQKIPVKMDLGAVYDDLPKNRHTCPEITPIERELVFDIDLSDYDNIRRCGCKGAAICHDCWYFMKCAVVVVNRVLRQDFGYHHIAWFYSGRRGIHCWVCDKHARALNDQGRTAVVKYLSVHLGNDKNQTTTSVLTTPLHPSLKRSLELLTPMFEKHILNLHKVTSTDHFLDALPEPVRDVLEQRWSSTHNNNNMTDQAKWKELEQHLTVFKKAGRSKSSKTVSNEDKNALDSFVVSKIFQFCYPRLDVEVSKKRNHLLKSPFCVHPKTGRVCVYISNIDTFDPFAVPTLETLVNELDSSSSGTMEDTSLFPYLQSFRKEFLQPLQQSNRKQMRDHKEQVAAVMGDF